MTPTKEQIKDLVKEVGINYQNLRNDYRTLSFEEFEKLVFDSFTASIIGKKPEVPTGIRSQERKKLFNTTLRDLLTAIEEFGITLCALHFRSPKFKSNGGRISVIKSINENNEIKNFHTELLNLYFSLHGRINTFNERIFDNYINKKKDFPLFFSVRFKVPEVTNYFEDLSNGFSINIPCSLSNDLLSESLLAEILSVNIEGSGSYSWYDLIKVSPIMDELNRAVDKIYHQFLTNENSFDKWKRLLRFLDNVNEQEIVHNDWNQTTKIHLKRALKFLQGILIYKTFAPESISTIVTSTANEDIFGISFGFSKEKIPDAFFNDWLEISKEFGGQLIDEGKLDSSSNLHTSSSESLQKVFGPEIVKEIKENFEEATNFLIKCSQIIEKLKSLAFATHEGQDLNFILYIGKQTSLTRFIELYEFSDVDVEMINSDLPKFFMSHYSLFQNNLRGIFFDIDTNNQISLVAPLNLIPSLKSPVPSQLKTNIINTTNFNDDTTLKMLTGVDKRLLILEVGKGIMKIYFNGRLLLSFPDKRNYEWSIPNLGAWSESSVTSLFEKCLEKYVDDENFLEYLKTSLSNCILKISDEPGKGGMIIFAKSQNQLENQLIDVDLNAHKIEFWKGKYLYKCDFDDLYGLIIPDGATIIDLSELTIRNQIQVYPLMKDKGDAIKHLTSSKGTRHRTGKLVSKISETVVVCISSDGPITVYYKGERIESKDISSIDI